MKSFAYKFFYSALALSLSVFVFFVNAKCTISELLGKFNCNNLPNWIENLSPVLSYVFYFIVLIAWATLLAYLAKYLTPIKIQKDSIESIEPAGEGLMLTYLGLVFFAVSVKSGLAMLIIFMILLLCILLSNVYMFNPIFSLIKYRFYYITFKSGKKCLLLSKEEYEFDDIVEPGNLHKLNEFTFIEY